MRSDATAPGPVLRRLARWRGGGRSVARLGIAIGADRVVAVELGPGLLAPSIRRVHARPLAPPTDGGEWPDLTAALAELLATLGVERATAGVALLGPLAKTKVIHVPRLGRRDLRALVTRNARRYFIAGAQPVVADAMRVEHGHADASVAAVATWAGRSHLAIVQNCLEAAGVHAEVTTAGSVALLAAVCRRVRDVRRRPAVVLVGGAKWSEVIAVRRGRPCVVQPGLGSAADLAALNARLRDGGAEGTAETRVVVVAEPGERERVMRAAHGVDEGERAEALPFGELEPAAVAAYGATLLSERAPQLLTDARRRRWARGIRRRLVALGTAAVALLGLTAVLYLVNLRREYDAVAAERQVISADVARALEMRRSVEAVRRRLEAIAAVEDATLDWTPTFAALAQALPDSAYLVSLTADGVELRLAGIASAAAAVVPALEASPLLRNVSLTVARRSDGAPNAERFDVALVVGPERSDAGGPEPGGGNRP